MTEDIELELDHVAVARYLDAVNRAFESVIVTLFGPLPVWLPEPKRSDILRAIALLEGTGVSLERLPYLVTEARSGTLNELPGSVKESALAIACAFDLAHIQWAISLPKADAIRELAGDRAARDYMRSQRGNEAQHGSSEQRWARDREIQREAANLRNRNSALSENAVARKLAERFSLSAKQIKRVLKGPEK